MTTPFTVHVVHERSIKGALQAIQSIVSVLEQENYFYIAQGGQIIRSDSITLKLAEIYQLYFISHFNLLSSSSSSSSPQGSVLPY